MVYVFKTSIEDKRQIKSISKNLNKITDIKKWNFDLEDCDNILRIIADKDVATVVCEVLNTFNHTCVELQ